MRADTPRLFWWQRMVQRLTTKPWASHWMTNRLHRWDRWTYRLSKGRWTATEVLSGLPVIFITTIGVMSGLERRTPLLAIHKDGQFILIATNFGSDRHPQWYFNLKAHPMVEVAYQGQESSHHVTELEGGARESAWKHAVAHYPGYQAYEQRANQRRIPVLELSPPTLISRAQQ